MADEDGRQVNAQRSPYEPGQFVRHPAEPGWGLGQVQSVVGDRVTVNFADAGKILINTGLVALDVLDPP
jgi:transcription elongation factor GreA-like protein